MSASRSEQNLFIVDLHYVAAFDQIDPLIKDHVAFLEANYASGHFIASGPKVPRTGGVIIATADSLEAVKTLLEADPFHKAKVARYTITEFYPKMTATKFDFDKRP
ncbi:MAG: YciI family protein [Pseudomonadota bacterium]